MKEKRMIQKVFPFIALFALFLCLASSRANADNADLGGVTFNIWYKVWNENFGLSYLTCKDEPKPFVIQYGTETVSISPKQVYPYNPEIPNSNYYEYPLTQLKNGWENGVPIKLVSVPVPDGYELCFSGQPVLTADSGSQSRYVSCTISSKKAGEKVTMDTRYSFSCDIEVTDGKPEVIVEHNGIPLTEGIDYTLSWKSLPGGYRLQAVVTGKGGYTGTLTDEVFTSQLNADTAAALMGKEPDSGDKGSSSSSNTDKNTGSSASTVLKKGQTVTVGNYRYKITKVSGKKGTVSVAGLKNKKTTSVSIPSTVKTKGYTFTVTAVGNKAFKGNKYMKKVTISKKVKTIGSEAFYKCTALTSVKLSSGTASVGAKAFYGCKKLKTLSLPGTLTAIGDYAFYSCSSLKTLSLPKGLKTIGKSSFAKCTGLTKVTIPSTVTTVKTRAFYGCSKLKSVKISSSKIKTAGSQCFGKISSKAVVKAPAKKAAAYKKLFKYSRIQKA